MDRRDAIKEFFRTMQQSSTEALPEHLYYLRKSMLDFDSNESKENAEGVYLWFTELNRFEDKDGKPLINLMDTMKAYEERSSTFTESQRDHYVHSVNVFLLGMQIYMSSGRFRDAFSKGESTFENSHERFLYTWGHAALFHDIGYPVEIALNQAKAFTRTIARIGPSDDSKRVDASLFVHEFELISEIPSAAWGDGCLDLFSLMSDRVSSRLSLDGDKVYGTVSGFVGTMRDGCFIDHGYYSALILLRSMAVSMQNAGLPEDRFSDEIVEAASAILLHNFYRGVFTSDRYDYRCGPMKVSAFPLAFLLILCDELQDWNRERYGVRTRTSIFPENSRVSIRDDVMTINYRTTSTNMCPPFVDDKKVLLRKLLDLGSVFEDLRMTCSCDRSADILMASIEDRAGSEFPRPMLQNMIDLAKEIHNDYNRKRRMEHPDEPLEYPTWEGLPQDLKYSNIMQALNIPDKVRAIGCHIGQASDGIVVDQFSDEEVLLMAIMEHDRWRAERESNGWIWGPEKDVERRISPYIADWDQIPEDIQRYDIEAVENIIPLLDRVGLKVLRDE